MVASPPKIFHPQRAFSNTSFLQEGNAKEILGINSFVLAVVNFNHMASSPQPRSQGLS
jgi:hypothetical protein